jgi:hypothetical protein
VSYLKIESFENELIKTDPDKTKEQIVMIKTRKRQWSAVTSSRTPW